MTRWLFSLAPLVALSISCSAEYCEDLLREQSEQSQQSPAAAPPSAIPQPYSVDGTLTQSEAAYLYGLAWPQTYDAMKGSFGLPAYKVGENIDIYLVEGTTARIQVFYDGYNAIGYEVK